MREIKFRAWNTSKAVERMLSWEFIKQIHMDEIFDREHLVVMQYTGIKDKNGKEIYSDDIIKVRNKIFRVVEDMGGFTLILLNNSNGEYFFYSMQDMAKNFVFTDTNKDFFQEAEVIGNIYENGHSLKTV